MSTIALLPFEGAFFVVSDEEDALRAMPECREALVIFEAMRSICVERSVPEVVYTPIEHMDGLSQIEVDAGAV